MTLKPRQTGKHRPREPVVAFAPVPTAAPGAAITSGAHVEEEHNLTRAGNTVYLVSCVSQKQSEASPARDLYVSAWFQKARRFAEASGCRWFVLSAKYGLVAPGRVIRPYEQTLNTMRVAERRAWAKRVSEQLADAAPEFRQVVFLAGARYREFLAGQLTERGASVSIPMKGQRIGEQLRWLEQHSPPAGVTRGTTQSAGLRPSRRR